MKKKLITKTEFAKKMGVTKQAIDDLLRKEKIESDRGKINLNNVLVKEWVARHKDRKNSDAYSKPSKGPRDSHKAELVDQFKKTNLEKIKIIEQTKKLQMENEVQRGELISKKSVQAVFDKLAAIESNELLNFGNKITPRIISTLGLKPNAKTAKVNKLIETEMYKTINHIKKIMADFLVKIQAKKIK